MSQSVQYGNNSYINTTDGQGPLAHILSNADFLSHVEAIREDIQRLSRNIAQIASLHQRAIASVDNTTSTALESLVTQTQVLNIKVKDDIRILKTDAAHSGNNSTKDSQIRSLQNLFREQLEQYREEETAYKRRYQAQIERQYRIVNPDANDEEVREAGTADWGDDGVFQTALRSNRYTNANSVLAVARSRHHDIQQIERTLIELNQLFQDLAETIAVQDPVITKLDEETAEVVDYTKSANVQLSKGIASARRARKLKWIVCGVFSLVLLAVVIAVIIYVKIILPQQERAAKAARDKALGN